MREIVKGSIIMEDAKEYCACMAIMGKITIF